MGFADECSVGLRAVMSLRGGPRRLVENRKLRQIN